MEEDQMDIRETAANAKTGNCELWYNKIQWFNWIGWKGAIADTPHSAIASTGDKEEKESTRAESDQDDRQTDKNERKL